jgi:hypothetical protein
MFFVFSGRKGTAFLATKQINGIFFAGIEFFLYFCSSFTFFAHESRDYHDRR